jgi:alpha-galactosidase
MMDTCKVLQERVIHLSASGVSVVLFDGGGALPTIGHWGPALDVADEDLRVAAAVTTPHPAASSPDTALRPTILPAHARGWMGRPGVEGHRGGAAWSTSFSVETVRLDREPVEPGAITQHGAARVEFVATDRAAGLTCLVEVELEESGLLRARATISDDGTSSEPYDLGAVRLAFPLPTRAAEALDFTGRWGAERIPQRSPILHGTRTRESRRGRTGLDASIVVAAGVPGFGFERGEVWALHVGFSGNHEHTIERQDSTSLLLGGELLLRGEVRLSAGGSYRSPWVYGSYGEGLDAAAARFHAHLRASRGASRPRPVTLNVWEAVYFDHREDKLRELAAIAAEVGVERFVLDDGWFSGRRHDRAGLGDWTPDSAVWPDGLAGFAHAVRGLGMEFGLWVEPEMISADSNAAREHPEWILRARDELPLESRHQQVIDLTNPAAFDHVLDSIDRVVTDAQVSYLKWDHNRDLLEAGHPASGAPAVHEQTLAAYRLMDEISARHPGLEIESCSSGGGRIDLGVLERTDRVWVSDNMDPVDRRRLLVWTGMLVPPEMLGSHVASSPSHTTGRSASLAYRASIALLGHFGLEWDLTSTSADERLEIAAWIAVHKSLRDLLRSGVVVNADTRPDELWIHGVVSESGAEGVFVLAAPPLSADSSQCVRLPGLRRDARYRVETLSSGTAGSLPLGAGSDPEARVIAGSILSDVGFCIPTPPPDTAVVLQVSRVD